MIREIVFMLEEASMKGFLEELLPRHFPNASFRFIPHEGKSDLERSLPRKLKAWRSPAIFIVVRDQDAGDCKVVKKRLADIATAAGRSDTVIRIACRELESWLLGDLHAVERAFREPGVTALGVHAKFRNPDNLGNPAQELKKIIPAYQKLSGSRVVGQHADPARNASPSFRALFAAVQRLAEAPLPQGSE